MNNIFNANNNDNINGNSNDNSNTLHNLLYKYLTFILNFHIIFGIFIYVFKMAKYFLLCITLFVVVLFLINIINIEELGMSYWWCNYFSFILSICSFFVPSPFELIAMDVKV